MKAIRQAGRPRRLGLWPTLGISAALIAAGGSLVYPATSRAFGAQSQPRTAAVAASPVPGKALDAVAAMQPGWNLGNTLDAVPDEGSWGNAGTTKALFDAVRAQGFKSVRIPVTWTDHQGPAPSYTVDPVFMKRVKQVVDWALADDLYVILNVHHDSWQWITKMPGDHDGVLARFDTTWTQIAAEFRDEPARLTFESVNEPVFDNATDAQKTTFLNELNTSFHHIVRRSGGHNPSRLLVLPTLGDTPEKRLTGQLLTTITALNDPHLAASVHYYGYWPFSVNIAGSTRFDSLTQQDMSRSFKLMHDTFVAKGIPVIVGEVGLLGYDSARSGIIERGEQVKYFEALGNEARINGVTTSLWDTGSFIARDTFAPRDPGLLALMKSSWSTRSGTASSDMVFLPASGPIGDRVLSLNLNMTRFKGLSWGNTRLVMGRDFTVAGHLLTLKAAALTRMVASRTYGVNATLYVDYSAGVPWQIDVITYDAPVLSGATGTTSSFSIPSQLRGDLLATMEARYADGSNAGPAGWTPYKQSYASFHTDSANKAIVLTPAFFKEVNDGKQVTLTFHFWSGTTVTYHVTTSGSSVTGSAGGTTPAGAAPAPTTPVGAVPTSTTPVGAVPTSTTPVGAVPTSTTSVGAVQAGAGPGYASTPLAGRIKPGQTRHGVATFYQGAQNTGACLLDRSPDHLTAAMNWMDYEGSNACGAYVEVHGTNGATITVRVTNLCPSPCRVGQLDLDPEAYKLLAPLKTGQTPITWKLVSPKISGGIAIRYKTGSTRWWCGIQAINHRNPVARLEVMAGGAWKALPRAGYNYFLSANGSGCGGAIRVTDIYGQSLVIDPHPIKPDATQWTNLQFAAH